MRLIDYPQLLNYIEGNEKNIGRAFGFSYIQFRHKADGFCPADKFYPVLCFNGSKRRKNQPQPAFFCRGLPRIQRKPRMACKRQGRYIRYTRPIPSNRKRRTSCKIPSFAARGTANSRRNNQRLFDENHDRRK